MAFRAKLTPSVGNNNARASHGRVRGENTTTSYLVFAFEHEHVGDFAERYAQVYDFGFRDLVGYVAYVYHPGRLVVGGLV